MPGDEGGLMLYHYTCDHGAAGISASGLVEVRLQPPEGKVALAWFTDLEAPNRVALGLTSRSLQCDRLAYRFTIPEPIDVVRYVDVRREHFPRYWREALESVPGAMPMHWYISLAPQRAEPEGKVIHG
jgi:hypothetical protein